MKPNIIYILADDMGYGDLKCNNLDSKIPTPNIDKLARNGMCFSDAHAGSSVCTPSRYNILTGRYCWRTRLKKGIVWPWDGPLIEPERKTVAHLLKEQGYETVCLGKWHLGMDWELKDGNHPNRIVDFGVQQREARIDLGEKIQYESGFRGGPTDRGFDSYFGVDVPNFPPYTWFENDRLVDIPTVDKPEDIYGFEGKAVPQWKHEKIIPELTRRAVDLIESRKEDETPFFLYFPLTAPHSPVVPNKQFKNKSRAGLYGDFVCEVDWVVGQINEALNRTGNDRETLVIFTSDNGPEDKVADDIGVYDRIKEHGHYSMGSLRGIKRDVWEGGHRVPFIACWPEVIPAGSNCEQLISLGDFMATCSDITGAELDGDDCEDSISMLPLMNGFTDHPVRQFAIHHSSCGKFAVRKGNWVLIDDPSGSDNYNLEPEWFRKERKYVKHGYSAELFDLSLDLSERMNCFSEHGDIAQDLSELLSHVKESGNWKNSKKINDNELTE